MALGLVSLGEPGSTKLFAPPRFRGPGPGIEFAERIRQAVGGCDVLLVIVGPRWATLEGADGSPRLGDPDDSYDSKWRPAFVVRISP
jgi:hypothetical protein